MTFVGKILVILIMAFSLVFLGVSTVVFSTATNWKTVAERSKADLAKKTSAANDLETRLKEAQAKLETAKSEHQTATTERENKIKDLDKRMADASDQAAAARGQLEQAQRNAQVALSEATARKAETETLVATTNKAQAQATQFNDQNLELTDRVRILEREKATAEQNSKDLRNYNAKLLAFVRSKGLTPGSLQDMDATSVPPQVEGRVNEVDPLNKSVEISIGSNDGLVTGNELFLFRTQPRPQFLAKVKIVATYPNKAVADVIGGKTVNSNKILEGDIVASSFNAR